LDFSSGLIAVNSSAYLFVQIFIKFFTQHVICPWDCKFSPSTIFLDSVTGGVFTRISLTFSAVIWDCSFMCLHQIPEIYLNVVICSIF